MAKIKIFALGGLGENGKNMYVVEVNQHIFILDAGIKYPDIDMYGVDAVIPNINYLIKNKDRIEGIFITHGHEDHISALPYLLKKIPTRVYGTHFTICLIENLLSENKMDIKNYNLKMLLFQYSTRLTVYLNQSVLPLRQKMAQLYIVLILTLAQHLLVNIKHLMTK